MTSQSMIFKGNTTLFTSMHLLQKNSRKCGVKNFLIHYTADFLLMEFSQHTVPKV